MKRTLTLAAALIAAAPAFAQNVQITEWMYSGNGGEFVEFTNLGGSAVDFSGWSYDDDSRTPGVLDLSSFGLVGVGESVIITEVAAATFRTTWGLDASVKVIGGYTNNLGRSDEINLYSAGGVQVDQFAYSDEGFPGTVRTQGASGNPLNLGALVPTAVSADWVLASASDAFASYASASGDLGNPGAFIFAPVPEPASIALLLAGLGVVGAAARRRG